MTTDDRNLIIAVSKSLDIDLPENISLDGLRDNLAGHINYLIQTNFQKLVALLYRVDVSEQKLKTLLNDFPGSDAGKIIADLIIERQLEKIKSRQQFSQRDNNIDESEKW